MMMNSNIYLLAFLLLTTLFIIYCIVSYTIFRKKLDRMNQIRKGKNVWISGTVTNVGDGDGFKLVEYSILCRNKEPLSIRLAAIDAPEIRYFNRPAQPYANESKQKLKELILNKKVTIKALNVDRYNRIVAMVFIKRGLFRRTNVNMEMIRLGMACVYKSKYASFDGLESIFILEESKARERQLGIWSDMNFVYPQNYKRNNNGNHL